VTDVDPITPEPEVVPEPEAARERPRQGVLAIALAIVAGLVYAFFFWASISRLIALPDAYPKAASLPWGLAVAGIAIPVVAYVLAFVVALRMALWRKALVYLLGLALLAAASLTVIAFEGFSAGV
jgi:hypothetical protein